MKYEHSDILLLKPDSITKWKGRFALTISQDIVKWLPYWKHFKIKIMRYLQDFYPLHIDDSYIEYVISELKYDDNDILLLDVDKIVNTATALSFDCAQNGRNHRNGAVMKALKN